MINKSEPLKYKMLDWFVANLTLFIPWVIGIYIFDKNNKYFYVNNSGAEILGLKPCQMIGSHWRDLKINPKIMEPFEENLNKVFARGTEISSETRVCFKNEKYFKYTLIPFKSNPEINNVELVICIVSDITEQKLAEKNQEIMSKIKKNLQLIQEVFYKFLQFSPNLLFICRNSDKKFIEVNKSFLEMTGYSKKEIINKSALDLNFLVSEKNRTDILKALEEKKGLCNLEISYQTKNGEVRIGLLSVTIVRDLEGEELIVGIINDITERKKLEKEIVKLDKLNLIGQMAASISHEVKNPLTTIKGFLQLFKTKEEFNKYQKTIELMIEEIDRSNQIISEYLSIGKNKKTEKKLQDLNSLIKNLLPLLQADALHSNKYVQIKLEPIPQLLIDEKEIRQLLLNLVRNGLEATKEKGIVTIKTYQKDNKVVLSVIDQGEGIKPDILEKLGTPFLTTKEFGTGLGLPICYNIAKKHGASINVDTGPKGTTFSVYFHI